MSAPVLTNYFEQTTFACGHTRLATHGMGLVGLNPALLNHKSAALCPTCAAEDAAELRAECPPTMGPGLSPDSVFNGISLAWDQMRNTICKPNCNLRCPDGAECPVADLRNKMMKVACDAQDLDWEFVREMRRSGK